MIIKVHLQIEVQKREREVNQVPLRIHLLRLLVLHLIKNFRANKSKKEVAV